MCLLYALCGRAARYSVREFVSVITFHPGKLCWDGAIAPFVEMKRDRAGVWILDFLIQVQFVQLSCLLLVVLSFAEIPGCIHTLNLRVICRQVMCRWIWSAGTCGEWSGIRGRLTHPWPSDKRNGVRAVFRQRGIWHFYDNLLSR